MAETIQRHSAEQNETSGAGSGLLPLSIDQLDYMADLVAELREMSERSGLTTLAAILASAQTEAAEQMKKQRS